MPVPDKMTEVPPGPNLRNPGGKRGANTRNPEQRDLCRRVAVALYCKGHPQRAIAETLARDYGIAISVAQVCLDIKAVRAEWREEYREEINELKLRELGKIDNLERTYWEGFERSQRDRERRQTKRKREPGEKGDGGKPAALVAEETAVIVEGKDGDHRWLAGVQWCIERRIALLGIEAPRKVELAGADGGPIKVEDGGMPDEVFERAFGVLKERILAEAATHGPGPTSEG